MSTHLLYAYNHPDVDKIWLIYKGHILGFFQRSFFVLTPGRLYVNVHVYVSMSANFHVQEHVEVKVHMSRCMRTCDHERTRADTGKYAMRADAGKYVFHVHAAIWTYMSHCQYILWTSWYNPRVRNKIA